MFMALLDVTIVNIAIPAIIADLGSSVSEVSWVISAYSLTLAALFLCMGRISDKFGQKRVFIGIGLVVFTVFSLLCGLAPTIEWLIAFRVGQGVGGAALAPISLAILLGAFPRRQHGIAVGIWGAMGSVAAALGPTLGGLLIQYLCWHWIFFMNVPVGIAAIAMATVFIPERDSVSCPGHRHPRYPHIGLRPLLPRSRPHPRQQLGLDLESHPGSVRRRDHQLPAVHVVGTADAVADVRLQTAAHPFLHGRQLRDVLHRRGLGRLHVLARPLPRERAAVLRAQGGDRDDPHAADGADRGAPCRAPRGQDRPPAPGVVGALFFVVGLVLLAQLNGESTVWDATWRTIFLGAGIGFAMPTFSSAAMGSLPPRVAGVGSGALNTLRQVGFSLGLAIVVAIFSHTLVTQTKAATAEAVKYVQSQTQIPAPARAAISAGIVKSAAEAQGGGGGRAGGDPLASAPPAAPGLAMAQQQAELRAAIGQIYRDDIADAFTWPFYAAALAALFAVFPALFTGRRLGADAGHEEMTRGERSADRTLAAQEAADGAFAQTP